MENANRIVSLVSEGLSPSEVAKECNLTFEAVAQEISMAVLAGQLIQSQVQFTLNPEWLRQISLFAQHRRWSAKEVHRWLNECGFDCDLSVEEVKFYMAYCGKNFRAGETYELLCDIERTLHAQIRQILVEAYGPDETGWWRQGVPDNVRKECVWTREDDKLFSGDPPYAYTTLISLKDIIKDQWPRFVGRLPKAVADNKRAFMEDLVTLNAIRNRVMHPVRAAPPSEEDFDFVKRMREALHRSKWRKYQGESP